MDRHPIALASLLEVPPDAPDTFEEHVISPSTRSAKITELVRYLKAFDSGDKTLVFSQFTTFLDRVAAVLQEEGIKFCRFDGSMPAKKASAYRSGC
jgi:SWI/SNF-related matrix-associated actin-dependent regulator of chromatin subfamily A3